MKRRRSDETFSDRTFAHAGTVLLPADRLRHTKSEAQEDAETIQVYLWNTTLYENYAPYIQSQLPDVNIEFIVGNNDLDFTNF